MILLDGMEFIVVVKQPGFVGDSHVQGYIDYDECAITVRQGMSLHRKELTLFHEMLHQLLNNETGVLEHEHEAVVARLAEKLYTTLQANNMLREGWFTKMVDLEEEVAKVERERIDYDRVGSVTAADEPIR